MIVREEIRYLHTDYSFLLVARVLLYQSGVRCSSMLRAFAHCAKDHRIDPPWWTH